MAACRRISPAKAKRFNDHQADLVDCMVALPGQLILQYSDSRLSMVSYETRIATTKLASVTDARRALFVCSGSAYLIDRVHSIELTDGDLYKIADLSRLASREGCREYEDVAGCKSCQH